ncbi:acyl carrier protein [Micromonospora chersina]|uniref:acyl carrier protein n=1 Tax=Micromonospora chersina TaxID=47854 RepID=UPI0037139681
MNILTGETVGQRYGRPTAINPNSQEQPVSLARQAAVGAHGVSDYSIDPPTTATEHRLAAAWAEVLGVPKDRVGRNMHFFDGGGSSHAAIRLVILLDRRVSLRDLADFPVLADLASFLDTGRSHSDAS